MENSLELSDIIENFSEKDICFALYGLALGDGSYQNKFIRITHTLKQKFYCKWLHTTFYKKLKVTYRDCYFRKTTFGISECTDSHIKVPRPDLFENFKIVDDKNKKIISEYVLQNISTLGLLFWYLDDGQLHVSNKNHKAKRFAYLNTQGFSYEENMKIVNMFKERFNINTKLHKNGSGIYKDRVYCRVYFNATEFRKFYDLVKEYLKFIPQEFHYKFNMKYSTRLQGGEDFSKMYNIS